MTRGSPLKLALVETGQTRRIAVAAATTPLILSAVELKLRIGKLARGADKLVAAKVFEVGVCGIGKHAYLAIRAWVRRDLKAHR